MSKEQVKINGNLINIDGFLSDTNKTYYAEPIKDGEIEGLRPIAEVVKKQILTDIRDYLSAILGEWHKRIDEPNFYEQNIGVYNHIRKELDDLAEYAEKLGVEL